MERFFDIFFSSISILIFLPILIPIILTLKLTGEGEIFFSQERVGKGGKIFKIYKFATMLKNSPNIGTRTITLENDPRILPFGRFLRKSKANELPQLLNILIGDMSIIGPRPLTLENYNFYSEKNKHIISKVRPGLSGIGSIIFRNEEKLLNNSYNSYHFYNNIIAPYKGSLEEWFVSKKNIFKYFLIIILTIWIIFFPASKLVWRIFQDLPNPPKQLKKSLNYIK